MMAEIWGRTTGTCRARAARCTSPTCRWHARCQRHRGRRRPAGVRHGARRQLRGQPFVSVCFFGDGASNQGTIFEAMNLASVWNLPVIFLAENNGYAEATSSKFSVACENIADRASAFGMPGVTVDGFDFFAVYEAAGEAIERAPERRRPVAGGGEAVPLLRPLRGRPADLPRPGRSAGPARDQGLPDAVRPPRHPERRPHPGRSRRHRRRGEGSLIDGSVVKALSDPKPSEADPLTDVRELLSRHPGIQRRQTHHGKKKSPTSRPSTRPSTRKCPATRTSSSWART